MFYCELLVKLHTFGETSPFQNFHNPGELLRGGERGHVPRVRRVLRRPDLPRVHGRVHANARSAAEARYQDVMRQKLSFLRGSLRHLLSLLPRPSGGQSNAVVTGAVM